jgi:hypothetical protein
MDSVTQQNAALVQESATGAAALEDQSEQLRQAGRIPSECQRPGLGTTPDECENTATVTPGNRHGKRGRRQLGNLLRYTRAMRSPAILRRR